MPSREKTLTREVMESKIRELFYPTPTPTEKRVGLELELWPFYEDESSMINLIPFYNQKGTGLIQLIKKLAEEDDSLSYSPTESGLDRFLLADGGQLTFEPGGQLEYSDSPKATIGEAITDLNHVLEKLRCFLKNHSIWFFHGSLNPWYTVEEVGLQLKKERYLHMNGFFKAIGHYGPKMMRLSTSLQINLDSGTREESVQRWQVSNLLAPIFIAAFGNSPFINRKRAYCASYRSIIWQNLDSSRTGCPQKFLDVQESSDPVAEYLDFALNAYCMHLPDTRGILDFDGQFHTFQDWMENGHHHHFPTVRDWEDHLSTLFPDVRARGFFEIRYVDAQSKIWAATPGVFLNYLLYDADLCQQAIDLLNPYRERMVELTEVGAYKGMFDPVLAKLSNRILGAALEIILNSAETEQVKELCKRFLTKYTQRNRHPACDLLELNEGRVFSPAQYRQFEQNQLEENSDLLQIGGEYN